MKESAAAEKVALKTLLRPLGGARLFKFELFNDLKANVNMHIYLIIEKQFYCLIKTLNCKTCHVATL